MAEAVLQQQPVPEQQIHAQPKKEGPMTALRVGSRFHSELLIRKPEVKGLENLAAIPKDKGFVVAATHLTDIDMEAITANVARYRDVGIVSQKSNQEIPGIGGINRMIARNRMFEISEKKDEKGKHIYQFNPEDYQKMKSSLDQGHAVVMAGHEPSYDWQLPEKAGLGVVFLAQLQEDPTVLPAALDIDSQNGTYPTRNAEDIRGMLSRLVHRDRPNSVLSYGEALHLEKINPADLSLFISFTRSEERRNLTPEQIQTALVVKNKIQEQARLVMTSMANLLPSEKKGKWKRENVLE